MKDTSIYKNASGTWLTKGLFYETSDQDKSAVLYTLKDHDHKGYPSIPRLYLEMDDPTEVLFYETYFGGLPHWKKLLQSPFFFQVLEELREIQKNRVFSKYIALLRTKAETGDSRSIEYLLEEKYLKGKIGPTTKAKIKEEAQRLRTIDDDLLEDLRRIS